MWTILFVACSINNPATCYPGTASLQAASVAECRANGMEVLADVIAKNPRLSVKAWTCRPPVTGLRGAIYE